MSIFTAVPHFVVMGPAPLSQLKALMPRWQEQPGSGGGCEGGASAAAPPPCCATEGGTAQRERLRLRPVPRHRLAADAAERWVRTASPARFWALPARSYWVFAGLPAHCLQGDVGLAAERRLVRGP